MVHNDATAPERVGFHMWNAHGSFEVFYFGDVQNALDEETGYYWWPCFPGCLPDGDPFGPFTTSELAYADAMESESD